ncbi:DUF2817 domain-containing protein [Bradyrhizobium sp. BWA-3-5]|uniref:DUF2817 domain-containing protein n=1 Tax=Bradyrhizobium sp. BWA-3-5 TaxID=3080013 RepID=UPI00293E8E1A|nr:DUF2817 domain-containing protein [Bradyrhizobium sp. BWA-3-5]WOH63948.1 DUF2817 domain-containing protein [Bradyrhizobium sp. BWA-3-5]
MNLDSAMQLAPVLFSNSYLEARQKFLGAAPTSKAYACSAKGPSGEVLFTDVAYFGNPEAKRLLVLVSGTHGAEGYCGSAAQLSLIHAKFHEQLPSSTAVLCIHALNCYGFAWDRRATAEGCDLNRNYIDFSKPPPSNPGYEELADHFIPADLSEERLRVAEDAIATYRSVHGDEKMLTARMSGQYTRPGGLYYGGSEPTEARRLLERIAKDFDIATRGQVVIVDYHTGFGPYGYGELQCVQASGAAGYERAVNIFGPSVTSPDLGNMTNVVIHGSQGEFWQRILRDRHTYVNLEFGTYRHERGAKVVRDEHWLFMHRPEAADSELGRQIRNACKLYFCPDRLDWKEMILWRSHLVHRQALEALLTSE